mgnify:FL=1
MKGKNIVILIVFILVILIFTLCFAIINKPKYNLKLPEISDVSSIFVTLNDNEVKLDKEEEITSIITTLMSNGRTTKIESIQDFPVNVSNVITIKIYHKSSGSSTLFVYERKGNYYLEQPYNGIYEISSDEYNSILNFTKETNALDKFYDTKLTTGYVNIKQIKEDYTIEEAINDKCFVVNHAKVYNENLYEEFMNKYNNKESAYIRLVQPTTEGDLVIYDIKYDRDNDKIILVTDSTRDKFAADNDRIISLHEYEKIGTYRYNNGNLFWVVYNGDINDETFNTDNTFILTVVN